MAKQKPGGKTPKELMKMFFEGGKQKNLEKVVKTLRDAGGITKAAARSLPKPSLNAVLSNKKIDEAAHAKTASDMAKKKKK